MISVPQDTLSPTEISEIEVIVVFGGQFQLPEGTELVSGVYAISLSKPLLKPIKLEIQHCLHLVNQEDTKCLSFATAPNQKYLPPYQFELIEGGQFNTNEQYGSICLQKFSLWTILQTVWGYFWPSPLYVGKVFYEEKKGHEWLMRFLVTRNLNMLHEVYIYYIYFMKIYKI